ncbi:MAG: type II toxin-antitoxin system RelE/ParE family toxin [Methanomicrobiales archaeon]|nr:type II toxin-antitoxin system RelE/ParE family toxin [Methanomicrobiales archaeon]MDI6875793.1 type II toxin-antitoxin system RelE/ParE family toxin [Methanomicrobiales archaeon]
MYRLTISKNRAQKLLDALPERSRRIVKEHLLRLQEDPYPGHGGDKKRLDLGEGYELYRIHIGRGYTAFYRILEEEQVVRIPDIMTIEQTHRRYGQF